MFQFNISIDAKRWLRGNKQQRKRIKNARMEMSKGIAESIAGLARSNLATQVSTHATGKLQNSIRVERASGGYRVVADAKSPDNNYYAQYVEYGTGIYNERGNGRKTPWFYDHPKLGRIRTRGQRAKPFFNPAVRDVEFRSSKILRGVWANRGLSSR